MRSRPKLGAMRSAHLIIGTTMLAVPASALALSSATPADGEPDQGTPELTLPSRQIRFGDPLSVSGTAPAAAGRRVVLEGAPSSPIRSVTVTSRLRVATHPHDVLAGSPLIVSGRLLPAMAGRPVALQGRAPAGWRTLAHARTGRHGGFIVRYMPAGGVGKRLRVLFSGDRVSARSVGSAGTVTVYDESVASWYYDGGDTACGFHAGLGVANVSLPCGTRVRFRYGGRELTAVVDDRGPYVGGREWDLNQNTAAALGFAGVGTVWAAVS